MCREESSEHGLSLNAVVAQFLGETKEDVHFTAISGLQSRTAEMRRQLAAYCLTAHFFPCIPFLDYDECARMHICHTSSSRRLDVLKNTPSNRTRNGHSSSAS
ncbi:hypothetical protein B0H10DRAFT_893052 [Mycena sp. CBHHK59/15]|nr:hypothetical protein B0H10DRAFT_893052 [Mycena sp. CBHHK59/15]